MVRLRELLVRFASPWVLAALALELALAIVDLSLGNSTLLTTAYLVPAAAVALFENGERTALIAAVSTLLSLASGAWDNYFLTGAHVYRMAIVLGVGLLAVAGAVLRERATRARDQMALLNEVSRIADGRRPIRESMRRLAELLVPDVAELCEIAILENGEVNERVSRVASSDQALGQRLEQRPVGPWPSGLTPLGQPVLLRDVSEEQVAALAPGEEDKKLLASLRLHSAILVPVQTTGQVLAMLTLAVGSSRRPYGREDLQFARTLASRAALAIQNAHLLDELQESRQRMETIVGSLADAVTIREMSGALIYANEAALRSMNFSSLEEFRRQDARALFGEYVTNDEHGNPLRMEDLPSVRLLRGEDPEPLLLRAVHPEIGDERWSLLKATPLYNADGELEAAVTIIEDVTATKRTERQTDFLSRASEILASSLDYGETLRNVAWLAVPEVADWCAVELVDEDGERQQVVAAHPDPAKRRLAERIREYEPIELDPEAGIGAVLLRGRSELYPEISREMLELAAVDEEHFALLNAVGMRSVLIVPLQVGNRVLGALTLVSAESGRRFTEEDMEFAEQIASRAAVAVENSRLYTQRSQIATTLQQSLLPHALPDIEGWDVAALYRPASSGGAVEVGGDFYDVFLTERGWMMLIGDVTGKGIEAAAMTSLVRHGARFVGEQLPEPAQVLARLDSVLRNQPLLSLCSALCLRIEAEKVTFASAGHPLPLLITDDGVRMVGSAGSVLGAFPDGDWPTEEVTVRPNEVLLLYTDGVTDTVGPEGRFGEQRLHRTMAECGPLAANELLTCLDKALSKFQVGPQADDTAALALRLAGEPITAAQGAPELEAT